MLQLVVQTAHRGEAAHAAGMAQTAAAAPGTTTRWAAGSVVCREVGDGDPAEFFASSAQSRSVVALAGPAANQTPYPRLAYASCNCCAPFLSLPEGCGTAADFKDSCPILLYAYLGACHTFRVVCAETLAPSHSSILTTHSYGCRVSTSSQHRP